MRLGAIHGATPASVPLLATRARLDLMQAPASADWFKACPADGDMLANDAHGDCVPVTDYRIIQIRRANAWGATWKPTAEMCMARYAALTGFNPATGLPDDGTLTPVDMTDWCTHGIRLDAQNLDVPHWCIVDPHNVQHVNLAIAHTGPVAVTINLPLGAQDLNWDRAPGTGSDWAPGSWGAHRVPAGSYDGLARTVRSWGKDLVVHPAFWAAYVISVDVALSHEWLDATGLSPSHLNWAQLTADTARLSG